MNDQQLLGVLVIENAVDDVEVLSDIHFEENCKILFTFWLPLEHVRANHAFALFVAVSLLSRLRARATSHRSSPRSIGKVSTRVLV